ncbi:MAG: flagellar basal body P-ring protein FlgI, partial [Phycisphaerae bacterium]|nr:flagellar basal body P-ring protein FlgI [Phycisphaerae bacterium]
MKIRFLTFACLAIAPTAGCLSIDWTHLEPQKPDLEAGRVDTTASDAALSIAYRDTIGQHGWIEGMRKMRVRGYGLVVGLGNRGSTQCPRQLRQLLIQQLYKRPEFQTTHEDGLTPEKLVDSRDTAVVTVQGEIPAAVPAGGAFDVYVQAYPGTQTVSLEGGTLWPCELRIFRELDTSTSIPGKALATAEGPLFRNPFATTEAAATQVDPRRAVIIGGGTTREDRRIRLVLTRPSHRMAGLIAERINARFVGPKIAEAESPSYIRLRVPFAYRENPGHFLSLVRHLYIPEQTGFAERRCRDLCREFVQAGSPHADIALALEGIGRPVLQTLRGLYDHRDPDVSYYAARTGIRLEDDLALTALIRHAGDAASHHRLAAIEEMGRAPRTVRAERALYPLLSDDDPRIRVAAYEGLLLAKDRSIQTQSVGRQNFLLDRLYVPGENLVYAKRSGNRRIAILGGDVRCEPPLFYSDPARLFILNASAEDDHLTIFRKLPLQDILSPPVPVDYDIEAVLRLLGDEPGRDANGQVAGLGIDYSSLVQALHELSRSRA